MKVNFKLRLTLRRCHPLFTGGFLRKGGLADDILADRVKHYFGGVMQI